MLSANEVKELLPEWMKERDEAVLSFDVEKFKAFFHKWTIKGFYSMPLPDVLADVTMYQCVLALAKATEEEKERARAWLREHHFNDDPWGERNDD